jgi:hypothetical protein
MDGFNEAEAHRARGFFVQTTGATSLDRYDGCHFSSSGAQKVANAWAGLLLGKRLRTEDVGSVASKRPIQSLH